MTERERIGDAIGRVGRDYMTGKIHTSKGLIASLREMIRDIKTNLYRDWPGDEGSKK